MKLETKTNKKKIILVAFAVIVACAAAYLGVAAIAKLPPFAATENPSAPTEQTVNLERSQTEKDASKALEENPDLKTQNGQTDTPDKPSETTASGKQAVNVLITNTGIFNGTVSASGMVTNVTENGGACTYTFTNGSSKVTKTSQTLVNPTSTTCETVSFPSSELPAAGTWKVALHYESDTSAGDSVSKEITK